MLNKRKLQLRRSSRLTTSSFLCTNDGSTSLANSSFIAINVHWIDSEFASQTKLIDMKPVEGKKSVEYWADVDDSLTSHNIKAKTFSFTTDNEPTMNATFSHIERNGCFAHIKSKACQKAMEDSKILKAIRKKLKKVARKSNKSPKFKRALKKEQRGRDIPVITLKQEVVTLLSSTKMMFDLFVPSKPNEEEVDIDAAKVNIEAINAAMKSSLSKKDFEKYEIEKKEVHVIVKILQTLRILEEGITRIGGEKYSTGSIVLPFLTQFLVFLKGDEDNPMYVRKFKKTINI